VEDEVAVHCASVGRPCKDALDGASGGRRQAGGPNWVLLLAIVFCVEFWVFMTNAVTQNF
jgi:hypothetical protein